jgi:hypothetical protein
MEQPKEFLIFLSFYSRIILIFVAISTSLTKSQGIIPVGSSSEERLELRGERY